MACHAASRAQFGREGLAATAVDAAFYDVNRRPATPLHRQVDQWLGLFIGVGPPPVLLSERLSKSRLMICEVQSGLFVQIPSTDAVSDPAFAARTCWLQRIPVIVDHSLNG
jgi:hypothetical protein